jgi:hypothetical protein
MDMNVGLVWLHIIVILVFSAVVIVHEDSKQERIKHSQ